MPTQTPRARADDSILPKQAAAGPPAEPPGLPKLLEADDVPAGVQLTGLVRVSSRSAMPSARRWERVLEGAAAARGWDLDRVIIGFSPSQPRFRVHPKLSVRPKRVRPGPVEKAVAWAAARGRMLLVPDLTRLQRPIAWHPKTNRMAAYTEGDFQAIRFCAPGVPAIVSLAPLDATPLEIRGDAVRSGMAQARAEGRPIGRPRRPLKKPQQQILAVLAGSRGPLTHRQIAERAGVNRRKLTEWIGCHDLRRRDERSLLALGLVRHHHLGGPDQPDVPDEHVYEVTVEGRAVAATFPAPAPEPARTEAVPAGPANGIGVFAPPRRAAVFG